MKYAQLATLLNSIAALIMLIFNCKVIAVLLVVISILCISKVII